MTSAIIGSIFAVAAAVGGAMWTNRAYESIVNSTAIPVDSYMNDEPSFGDQIESILLNRYIHSKGIHNHNTTEPYRIFTEEHPYIPGLKQTREAKDKNEVNHNKSSKSKPPIIIGTIRMGFGHYRIAYAVASYATAEHLQDRDVLFHDIVPFGQEGGLIDEAEALYSSGSRLLSELPHSVERILSKVSSSGSTGALRLQTQAANLMTSLVEDFDRDSPFIATHPLVGAIAVSANFTNVINLVVDNYPQWFIVVPGALNLVQGPKLYRELMKLGVPDNELELGGHWNPKEIADTIETATNRRIERVKSKKPLRLLVPVGGAGAQESFLAELVEACAPLVQDGKLQLLLNAADHDHFNSTFKEQLEASNLKYDTVTNTEELMEFMASLEQGSEPRMPVTLFSYNSTYPAVRTTDLLVSQSDVLVCKPSEMAFYAVPKLMIRRVGDHEAKSAIRAAEVGDGTLEAETIEEIMIEIEQFLTKPGDLTAMNRIIQNNNKIGMYDGAKIAVKRALERAS